MQTVGKMGIRTHFFLKPVNILGEELARLEFKQLPDFFWISAKTGRFDGASNKFELLHEGVVLLHISN